MSLVTRVRKVKEGSREQTDAHFIWFIAKYADLCNLCFNWPDLPLIKLQKTKTWRWIWPIWIFKTQVLKWTSSKQTKIRQTAAHVSNYCDAWGKCSNVDRHSNSQPSYLHLDMQFAFRDFRYGIVNMTNTEKQKNWHFLKPKGDIYKLFISFDQYLKPSSSLKSKANLIGRPLLYNNNKDRTKTNLRNQKEGQTV